jgi:hypothetical protein
MAQPGTKENTEMRNPTKSSFVPKNDRLWKPFAKLLRTIGLSKPTAQLVLRKAVRSALSEANPALPVNLANAEARRVALKFAA